MKIFSKVSRKNKRILKSILFLLPVLILAVMFFLVPLVDLFRMSLKDVSLLGSDKFIGLSNFRKLLFNDPEFWQSLKNTAIYSLMYTPPRLMLATTLAILVNRKIKGITFFRTSFFIPLSISFIIAGYIWLWMFNDTFGIFNYFLEQLGILKQPISWFGNTWLARSAVTIAMVWKTTGLIMIIILAGLQGIPEKLYEAAAVDGASLLQKHLHITIPQLRSTFALAIILSVVGSLKVFSPFYVMTEGGPSQTTQSIVMYLQKMGFSYYRLGYAGAISIVFAIMLLVLSVGQFKLMGVGKE